MAGVNPEDAAVFSLLSPQAGSVRDASLIKYQVFG